MKYSVLAVGRGVVGGPEHAKGPGLNLVMAAASPDVAGVAEGAGGGMLSSRCCFTRDCTLHL